MGLSYEGNIVFEDRIDGARQLARRLHGHQGARDAVILGLPRGGVVVGFILQQELDLPLDVFMTRRLRAPGRDDLALGAICESGNVYYDSDALEAVRPEDDYLEREIAAETRELERRKRLYRGERDLTEVRDRIVLVVDDGIATGSSVLAAVHGLRGLGAEKIVVAAPVASPSAVRKLDQAADLVVVVDEPVAFSTVRAYYRSFEEITDEAIVRYLRDARGDSDASAKTNRRSG